MNSNSNNFSNSQSAANYNDVIYDKSLTAFNGFDNSVIAKIVARVDPDGIIKIF